jgi:peptide/nickel transport system substrate-binding protein
LAIGCAKRSIRRYAVDGRVKQLTSAAGGRRHHLLIADEPELGLRARRFAESFPRRTAMRNRPVLLAALVLFAAMNVSVIAQMEPAGAIVIAQGTDAASLDPQLQNDAFSTSILSNVFDTLVYRNAELELEPGLALSWELVDDTTWRVDLREGVTFHNGEAFDADDVEFSLERPLDPALASPLASRFNVIEDVEVVDSSTVLIRTTGPYPLLPARLSEWFILPKDYVEATEQARLSANPIGTGAYRFVEWVKDDRLRLEAFEEHWRGAPAIREVTFRPIPEVSTRVAALQAGDVDLVTNVPAFRQQELDQAASLDVRAVPSTFFQYVGLDGSKNEALADRRVRQAIQYATNVPEIVEFLFDGAAAQIAVPLAFGTFGLDESIEPYPYDPERARELLAEAGYPNGIVIDLDAPVGRYAQDKEVAEALAGQWAEAGIRVNLNVNEWSVQLTKYRAGTELEESHYMGWGTSTFDADDVLFGGFANRPNKTAYENDEVTRLVLEARTNLDPSERERLYGEALRIIHEDVPWVSLFQQFDIYGVRADLTWEPRPDQKIEVRTISVPQD